MVLHRVLRDTEVLGDLCIRAPLSHVGEDVLFACGQQGAVRGGEVLGDEIGVPGICWAVGTVPSCSVRQSVHSESCIVNHRAHSRRSRPEPGHDR